jgi:integrase
MPRGQKLPLFIHRDRWEKLVQACTDDRSRAIVTLALFTGLRVGELCDLERRDVDFQAATVQVRNGKGAKQRVVDLNPEAARALKRYLASRGDVGDTDPVFLSEHGNPLCVRQVQRLAAALGARTGYPWLTPHKWRHSHATAIYQRTKDLELVRRQLGHEDIRTTAIYLHVVDEDRRKATLKL